MKKKPFKSRYSRITNPVTVALQNAATISDEINAAWVREELDAIDAMALRRGNPDHWSHLARMINLAEIMAKKGVGPEVIPVAAEAQVLLARVHMHWKKTGVWEMDMDQVHVMREAHQWHNLQRTAVSYGEYKRYFHYFVTSKAEHQTASEILEKFDALDTV